MKKPKTEPGALAAFLADLPDDAARADCAEVAAMMKSATRAEAKLWAGKMLGFGDFHYRYASGHEGDTFLVGYAYRKTGFSIYLGCAVPNGEELFSQLGKHKLGKGCLYVRRLADVDRAVLKRIVADAVKQNRRSAAEMKSKSK